MAVNPYEADIDLFIDYDDPENDRFTTVWDGPDDPRAVRYTARTGFDYVDEHGNIDLAKVSSSESTVSSSLQSWQLRRASSSELWSHNPAL
jgi:hypothetical protein